MGLRIGVVHWAFPPVIGGVEMHLLTIGPEMARQGAEVYVLVGSAEGSPAEEQAEGIRVERVDGMHLTRVEELVERGEDLYAASRQMFDAFLERHAIDAVQAHNLHYDFFELSAALVDACHERGVPCYLVIHNDVFIDRSERTTYRIVGDLAWDRRVPISCYIHETLAAKVPDVPPGRWSVIMHGIDLDRFTPAGADEQRALKREYGFEGRRVVLHTGRFLPWKGILPAVRSMPRIVEQVPDALMVFTGRAERLYEDVGELAQYDRAIDDYIAEHELSNHVHIGRYTHTDIPRLNALADVSIYTTIGDEPFGLVPVEAMACEVPVVVTRSGGLVESVVDGVTGFVIDKDEERLPVQLAERVAQILSDPGLARRLGRNGRERVERKFDKQRMARDFIRLSQTLIDARAEEES